MTAEIVQERARGLARLRAPLRGGRSPFTAKSFLLAAAAFLGAGGLWLAAPEKGSITSWVQPYAPAVVTLAGSFLGGFLVGWGARRALTVTALVAGVAMALLGLAAYFGMDGAAAEQWVNSSVSWMSANLDGAQRYLVALLPSAAAAGTGTFLGFRRR